MDTLEHRFLNIERKIEKWGLKSFVEAHSYFLYEKTVNILKFAVALRLDYDETQRIMGLPTNFARNLEVYNLAVAICSNDCKSFLISLEKAGNHHVINYIEEQLNNVPYQLQEQGKDEQRLEKKARDPREKDYKHEIVENGPCNDPEKDRVSNPEDKLGNFTNLGELGRGDFGVVYKIQNTTTQLTTALKVMKLDPEPEYSQLMFNNKSDPRSRYLIKVWQQWQITLDAHDKEDSCYKNWVPTHWFQEELPPPIKVFHFIHMEFCNKLTLQHRLQNPELNEDLVQGRKIFWQITQGLAFLHDNGCIHGDLKPSNILLTDVPAENSEYASIRETEIIAKIGGLESPRMRALNSATALDRTSFASPEQLACKEYTEKTDIYSLGLILYCILYPMTKVTVKDRKRYFRAFERVRQEDTIFPEQSKSFTSQFPEESELLKRMLSHDPTFRPSVAQVVQVIQEPVRSPFTPQVYAFECLESAGVQNSSSARFFHQNWRIAVCSVICLVTFATLGGLLIVNIPKPPPADWNCLKTSFFNDLTNHSVQFGENRDKLRSWWKSIRKPPGVTQDSSSFNSFWNTFRDLPSMRNLQKDQVLQALQADQTARFESLNLILNSTLSPAAPSCGKNGSVTLVQGLFLSLKEIATLICVNSAGNTSIKETIIVYAFHTIYLDTEFRGSALNSPGNVDLVIISPIWSKTVESPVTFDLSGVPGKNGQNPGESGTRGWDAGTSFGIGLEQHFVGTANIGVSINGGAGGNGHEGERGVEGKDGEVQSLQSENEDDCSAWVDRDVLIKKFPNSCNRNMASTCKPKGDYHMVNGTIGTKGGDGGPGGDAGVGGANGTVFIANVSSSKNNDTFRREGQYGDNGAVDKGGPGGLGGKYGDIWKAQIHNTFSVEQLQRTCVFGSTTIVETEQRADSGRKGKDGQVEDVQKTDTYFDLNTYKKYVIDYQDIALGEYYSNNGFFQPLLANFLYKMRADEDVPKV